MSYLKCFGEDLLNYSIMFSILNKTLADAGFYINLDISTERKEFVDKQIKHFNIQGLKRFTAITDDLRQSSCTKSHRAIFENALSNQYNSIFVAEDDFQIYNKPKYYNNFHIDLYDFLTEHNEFIINDNYDILLFGCNPKKNIIPINSGFGINQNSTGAWSYIIRYRAMRYILENYNYNRDYQAIDDILPALNGHGFKTLVTIPMLIGHRDGIVSTLQPHVGETSYSTWIEGNWDKHLYETINQNNNINTIGDISSSLLSDFELEKKLTVVIVGHCVDNWLFYLRYLLKSLPKYLYKCRFIISYDSASLDDQFHIHRYFRDIKSQISPYISFVNHGLISSLKNILNKVQTDYFLFLEHDWVFLDRHSIDYGHLLQAFDKYDFINAVWFNKDDNNLKAFDICDDINGSMTPFMRDLRIEEIPLITTCRWSNNPAIFRASKMKEWFNEKINNEYVNIIHQECHNIEEAMIPLYKKEILNYGWNKIKNNWGTFLYGDIGDGPYVGHTDASKRYHAQNKSQPEINGEQFIKNNPLSDHD
jgi:hypothetical protein